MALKKCEVINCPSISNSSNCEDVTFFRFPRNKQRHTTWVLFCKNPALNAVNFENLRRRRHICSLHFKQSDFKTRDCKSLLWRAVPTVQNPPQGQPSIKTSLPTSLTTSSPAYHHHLSSPSPLLFSPQHEPTFPPFDSFFESASISNFEGVEQTFEKSVIAGLSVSDLMDLGTHSSINQSNKCSTPKAQSLSLASIQMTRKNQMTPRKSYLYAYAKRKERALKGLKRRMAFREKQLSSLTDLSYFNPADFVRKIRISNKVSRASAVFLGSQLRCSKKKPKGRRWTLEEKLMALSIYKKSPKAYRFMRCMFALPCKKTLHCLLSGIPFGTGINEEIFSTLASTISQLENCDKMCILQFDEMSIREHLSYNSSLDLIVGVEDYGTHGRTTRLANQVMVFMVSGLLKKWKQPVAYYFSNGGVSSEMLVDLIKAVLLKCKKAGLRVMATVCDMGANQRKAVRLLGSTKMSPQFQFEGQNIITLFDPCHLIKCLRNQLFLHDIIIQFQIAGETNEGKASWMYCDETYQRDKQADTFRWLWKLTDRHMNPTGRDKLRVKLAAQVLSHSMAASIYKDVANGLMSPDALATGFFVEFVDQLFDSLNGSKGETCKKMRGVVTIDSPHLQFWQDAVVVIDSWQFLSNKPGKFQRPPSQDGLIMTLEGMKRLWTYVSQEKMGKSNVKYLVPRNVNQDALENTFGAVRANCGLNSKPNVQQFVGAFKSCIINGLAYQDVAKGSNCEDDGASLLSNLQTLLTFQPLENSSSFNVGNVASEEATVESFLGDQQDSLTIGAPRDLSAVSYVSGYIAKRILANSTCQFCRSSILDPCPDQSLDSGLLFKEYGDDRQRLIYPSEEMVKTVGQCAKLLEKGLEEKFHQARVLEKLARAMKQDVSFDWIRCNSSEHCNVVIDKIVKSVCLIGIPWWCKRHNRKHSEQLKQKFILNKTKNLQQSK